MRYLRLFIVLVTGLYFPTPANAISFQSEKDLLSKQFNCSNEQNLPGSEVSSLVWICTDEAGKNLLQLSRRAATKDLVDTLQLVFITENNETIDEALVLLSRTVASKYAKQSISDIVNIIKSCQQQRDFQSEFTLDVGCIKGPVKTERHLIVRMNQNQ